MEKYGLFAFQHRALERMLTFSYRLINFKNSQKSLKEQLVSNERKNLEYDLRNKHDFIEPGARTKSGENTFGYVFSRMSNKFIIGKLLLKLNTFKMSIFNNINLIYDAAIKIFGKLNLTVKN